MYHFVDENPNWYAHLVMLHRTSVSIAIKIMKKKTEFSTSKAF